jgi:hypothetical protein
MWNPEKEKQDTLNLEETELEAGNAPRDMLKP